MKRSTLNLSIESLSERVLPSTATVVSHDPAVLIVHHHMPILHGTLEGDYSVPALTPDSGTTYQLSATTKLNKFGSVTVTGSLHSVGNILRGKATGEVTITNAQGQVTLELTGQTQKAGSRLPSSFHYQVTSATGDFAGLKNHGVINLVLVSQHAQSSALPQGKFWLFLV